MLDEYIIFPLPLSTCFSFFFVICGLPWVPIFVQYNVSISFFLFRDGFFFFNKNERLFSLSVFFFITIIITFDWYRQFIFEKMVFLNIPYLKKKIHFLLKYFLVFLENLIFFPTQEYSFYFKSDILHLKKVLNQIIIYI